MAESEKVIRRAVAAGYRARSVLTSERWLESVLNILQGEDVPILLADDSIIREVAGYHVHRGALAAMQRKPLPSLDSILTVARRLVVLEGIVDHTNVGAAFRSVAGLGFDAILVDPTCADPLYRRSVRVSMGTALTLPWTRVTSWPAPLDELARQGFGRVALTPGEQAEPLHLFAGSAPRKLALLLGAEGHGLSEQALSKVDHAVRIPMSGGVDSLNIAAATAVACFALGLGQMSG
jgi:tRNA G18 (ribose-2'-O)-methylase SpoU